MLGHMRQNPLGDAFSFVTEFGFPNWLYLVLLLGAATAAFLAWRNDPAQHTVRHVGIAILRILIGTMWWAQSLWKVPPHYDWGLIHWMEEMVKGAAIELQSTLVRDIVLPNIAILAARLCGRGVHRRVIDSWACDACRWVARSTDGDQSLARPLQCAGRMAMDLYVPDRDPSHLYHRSTWPQPRVRRAAVAALQVRTRAVGQLSIK